MRHLLRYAALYSFAAAFLKIVGFALFLWLARDLSVEAYASFGLLYAMQTGIVTFSTAGIVEGVVGLLKNRKSAAARREAYSAAIRLFRRVTIAASTTVVLVFISTGAVPSGLLRALPWVLVSGGLLAFATLQAQLLRLEERHGASLGFSFIAPLLGFIGAFVVFSADPSAYAYFIGSAIGLSVALVAMSGLAFGFRHGAGGVEPVTLGTLLPLGAPFAVIALVGWLGGYGNNYLIQLILPSVEVARFTFVLSISSIMLLVATALNQVWNPTFYRITHERTVVEVEAKNRRFYRAQAAVLGLVGAVVVLSFPLAIRAVGGNLMAYESSRAELALLLGTYIVQSPGWHCQNYFLAYGRGSELMRICMTAGGLAIVTTAALMLSLGPMGIYLGVFSQAAARTAGTVYGARRRWPVRVSWGGVVIGLSVLAIAYAVGPS